MLVPIDLQSDISLSLNYIDYTEFFKDEAFLFYGFQVKNKYDEERLLIDESINPVRIRHSDTNRHFYGVLLEGNYNYKHLINLFTSTTGFEEYRVLFSEFNADTQDSYELFDFGIYPFDNLRSMSDTYIDTDKFFCNENVPFYQRISGLTAYIFCNRI
jgi:hypothetical protein